MIKYEWYLGWLVDGGIGGRYDCRSMYHFHILEKNGKKSEKKLYSMCMMMMLKRLCKHQPPTHTYTHIIPFIICTCVCAG
mgnify:CR=1 FL=1